MARVFTTTFHYQEKSYTAVISQIGGSLTIYIPEETLHSILPAGRVSFNLKDGIHIDTPQLSPAQDLIVSVLGTIEAKNTNLMQRKNEQSRVVR